MRAIRAVLAKLVMHADPQRDKVLIIGMAGKQHYFVCFSGSYEMKK